MDKETKTFRLTIKTPLETVFDNDVKSLVVDTDEGKMMVLPHHTSLVGNIKFSNIIVSINDQIKEYSIRRGFINISNDNNNTEILCIHCEQTQTLTYTSVETYLNFLSKELEADNLNPYQLQFLGDEKFAVIKQLNSIKNDGKKN